MKKRESQGNETLQILAVTTGIEAPHSIISNLRSKLPKSSRLIEVGKRNTDADMSGLFRMKCRRGEFKKFLKSSEQSKSSFNLLSKDKLQERKIMALDHLQRRSEGFAWSHHNLRGITDSDHYYQLVLEYFSLFLKQEKINFVLFFQFPHLFYDTLIYQIAESEGIEKLILTHSIFPARFFSLRQIEDHGCLPQESTKLDESPLKIDSDARQDWDYMAGIKQYRGEAGKLCWVGIFSLLLYLILAERSNFRPKEIIKSIGRMARISSSLPKWRYPFRRYFHTSHFRYYEALIKFEDSQIDLNQKFIYFALQLQPELTTSTLGGIYSDQILAIERLSSIIPNDCLIYVKENPKQRGIMRGVSFFERLNQIPKVRFLPSYADTHKCTDMSVFVATITGTVGWEAVCRGKNVLVFGKPWYLSLPGVFRFVDGVTYEQLSQNTIDHKLLEKRAGQIFARTHLGVVAQDIELESASVEQLNKNAELVSDTILGLLQNRIDTSFSRT